jgi:hypothetical protein
MGKIMSGLHGATYSHPSPILRQRESPAGADGLLYGVPLTCGVTNGTISAHMASIERIVEQMRREPANIGFSDLRKVCHAYFGKPRQDGSSHAVFKTPWRGDPRVNIQNAKGKAKPYQVRQVLQAIDKMEGKS